MRRRAKAAKAKVETKRSVAGKSRKNEGASVRDIEQRLAEALNQLQARNHELAEAREQQTATSEILRVMSTSPTDLQPVLDAVAESASRLCDAYDTTIFQREDNQLVAVAHHGAIPASTALPIVRGTIAGRAVLEARTLHFANAQSEDDEFPESSVIARREGWRSVLNVPMMREGAAIGVISIRRADPQLFTERQVALLETFADQAVIAIENVRLFRELEERNRALTESLARQTATGEVLRAISRAQTDVQPVFEIIATSARRLCAASYGQVQLYDGELIRLAALDNVNPEGAEAIRQAYPLRIEEGNLGGRVIGRRAVVQIPDLFADASYRYKHTWEASGLRSLLGVPMLRDGEPIGTIAVGRSESGLFPAAQVELLQTFADQAVIAIENVRLFTELQEKNRALTAAHAQVSEALEQQTATADILRVISSSPTDVQPVFDAIVRNAVHLCGAIYGTLNRLDGEFVHLVAHYGLTPEHVEQLRQAFPRSVSSYGATASAIRTGKVVRVPDLAAQSDAVPADVWANMRVRGVRSVLVVPMIRRNRVIGSINMTHREVDAFTEAHVELLKTFAEQAVIAIENVRLFTELEARTAALTRSVEQLTALGEVGRAVSSTLDLGTVLSTIVARAVQLSGADGGVVFEYDEGAEEFVQRVATETGDALAEARRTTRIRKGEGVLGRTAVSLEPVQVPDIALAGAYEGRLRGTLIASGIRAILAVPMVRESRLIGCLGVTRNQPGEFPAETIELLRTFATQSALAIQNARLFHEIEDKSRQLEAASQHKSEFLANMSHELRTPLNAIIGFSEVLLEQMFGAVNEKQVEYLQDILESGRHLLSLINDILDLSKIEAGRMELELTDVHLPQAIDNAMMLVRERAERRGISLSRVVDGRLAQIRGDEQKIRQVVLNLLSNAIKFTRERGRIELRAVLADEWVEVSVSDTGVGIAPEDQEAVFEAFQQVGASATKQEGTGLGLALCRKFVELHGGKIGVKSQVGVGSTFTFTLPVRRGN